MSEGPQVPFSHMTGETRSCPPILGEPTRLLHPHAERQEIGISKCS